MEGTVVALSDVTQSLFDAEQARQDQKHGALRRLGEGIAGQLGDWAYVVEASPRLAEALPEGHLRQEMEGIQRVATDALAMASRLRASLHTPEMEAAAVDMRVVVQELETAWKLIEPRLEVALELEPAHAQADRWQITRALVGILLHARSRMKGGSSLRVELSSAEVEQMVHAVRIRVSYATTEDAAAIEEVFEPRWTNTSQDLHCAYKLVRKMGGLVWARLERCDIAVFDVYLRRVRALAAGVTEPRLNQPAILLVDANAEVRRLLQNHFERNGYKLLATAGCEEAVLLAELYAGAIPLAIANLTKGDEARDWLSKQLAAVRPDMNVRLLSGYSEPRAAAAGETFDLERERHLTKWDLVEWARESLAAGAGQIEP